MIYSRTSKYAMRALAFMAKQPSGVPIDILVIGKSVQAPPAYIAKVFQGLVRAGIVVSQRGPKGGYFLKNNPESITLLDVLNATDDAKQSPLSTCVMGLNRCDEKNPCTLHDIWTKAAKEMKSELEKSTIKDLASIAQPRGRTPRARRILSRRIRAVFN